MKSVLFVDDDPNILAGLRRLLRAQRQEWNMEFVAGGQEALAHLAEHPVDVVVTDMRMPGMDGAELLKEIVSRHPSVARIVLSGQSDKESLIKVAGLAHQYLSKPCDTETLTATVRRVCNIRDYVSDENLKVLVSRMCSIPSLPSNYQELVVELAAPEPSMKIICEIIARDLSMTAKVLQLVNSAFFGIPRRVTSPSQAVALLGLDTVSGLVLSAGVFSQFDYERLGQFSVDELINHSLQVASHARNIAGRQSKDATLVNDAFVAGLLHDIGKLVLASNFPRQYTLAMSAAADWGHSLCAAERETFGADHAEVGAYILDLWGLPTPLIEAVAYHHDPKKSLTPGFTPLTAVHVANACACVLGQAESRGHTSVIDETYLSGIGALETLSQWRALDETAHAVGAST